MTKTPATISMVVDSPVVAYKKALEKIVAQSGNITQQGHTMEWVHHSPYGPVTVRLRGMQVIGRMEIEGPREGIEHALTELDLAHATRFVQSTKKTRD
jgi:hypothetical protein